MSTSLVDGQLDATAQAELVRQGECTPAELVDAAIVRIERLNPTLNAIIHPLFDKARAEARGSSLPDGPFRGVPIGIKDAICQTAGDPYHAGMRFLRDRGWRADHDSYLARRIRSAGFVIVGRTNTPELAGSVTTEPLAYGPSRNPWNLDRSTGGSSGGSAAAVASGMVPAAHGNDMGGSIRIPSSECGLVGLKPSRARTSLGPDFGEFWGPLTHEGVLTRSVRDCAGILDVVAGMEPGDPYAAPPPKQPFSLEVGAPPGRLRIGLRTAVPEGGEPTHPECTAAATAATHLLESCGHDVDEAWPAALDRQEAAAGYMNLVSCGIARDVERWSQLVGQTVDLEQLEPATRLMVESGRSLSAADYLAAREAVEGHGRALARWWAEDDYDLLLTPTLADMPPEIGLVGPDADPAVAFPMMARFTAFVTPFNISGQPAISLPLHWSDDGLPVGVQLVATYGAEDLLIRVAAQLEEAQPWAHRLPPVHAAFPEAP